MKKYLHVSAIMLSVWGVVALPFVTHGGGIVPIIQIETPTNEMPTSVATSTPAAPVVVPISLPKLVWNSFDIPELGISLKLPWTKDQVVTGCTQKGFDLGEYTPCTRDDVAAYYTLFKADDETWTPRLQAVAVSTSLDLHITSLKTIKNTTLFKPDQALIDQLNTQYTIKNELIDIPEYAIAVKQSSRTIILLFSMSDITQSREFLLSSIKVK